MTGCEVMRCSDFKDERCHYKSPICKYRENGVDGNTVVHIYNAGYMAGHNDTVEGCFTNIYNEDMNTYHSKIVFELLDKLND